jgi:hypothetical protein
MNLGTRTIDQGSEAQRFFQNVVAVNWNAILFSKLTTSIQQHPKRISMRDDSVLALAAPHQRVFPSFKGP